MFKYSTTTCYVMFVIMLLLFPNLSEKENGGTHTNAGAVPNMQPMYRKTNLQTHYVCANGNKKNWRTQIQTTLEAKQN